MLGAARDSTVCAPGIGAGSRGFQAGFYAPRYRWDVDRQPPRTTSNEIDLYIRTYYSLLRSTGDVRVRAFEEAHLYSA